MKYEMIVKKSTQPGIVCPWLIELCECIEEKKQAIKQHNGNTPDWNMNEFSLWQVIIARTFFPAARANTFTSFARSSSEGFSQELKRKNLSAKKTGSKVEIRKNKTFHQELL